MPRPARPQRSPYPWRILAYGAVVIYVFADIYGFQGPLYDFITAPATKSQQIRERGLRENWVAMVNAKPITLAQVDAEVDRQLYRRGKDALDLPATEHFNLRVIALDALINREVLRTFALGNPLAGETPPEEFASRIKPAFGTADEFDAALAARGENADSRRRAAGERAVVQRWAEAKIAAAVEPTDSEVAAWFSENGKSMALPERRQIRHLFLSRAAGADRRSEIEAIRARITGGELDLAAAARKFSDDPNAKATGGDLGIVAQNRLPEDFAKAAFAAEPGMLTGTVETKLGWHLILAEKTLPARPLEFAEAKAEVAAALANSRRGEALASMMRDLRERANIKTDWDRLRQLSEATGDDQAER